jgi:UTP--glucose-1-phosphate uridylyltransferase
VPKELLPLVDRAALQYVVEEIAEAGIEQVVIVTSVGKEAIPHYFERDAALEHLLESRGNHGFASQIRQLSNYVEFSYVNQSEQLGLGHAIQCASESVGREPFLVALPDEILQTESGVLGKMLESFDQNGSTTILVKEVGWDEVENYGVISASRVNDDLYVVHSTVEKPKITEAPSNLAIIGRYIFTPEIFDSLGVVTPGALGEIQLTDGISGLLANQKVYAHKYNGLRYDVGNPLGLLKASVEIALGRDDIGVEFMNFLLSVVKRDIN